MKLLFRVRIPWTPVGLVTTVEPSGWSTPPTAGSVMPGTALGADWKPWPTSVVLPVLPAVAPPHWTPMASSAVRSRISIRASILTCGSGMSSCSRISFLIRSRSAW